MGISVFAKVSFEQYKTDYINTFGEKSEEEIRKIYDAIRLPKRATSGSAGYDFFSPININLKAGEEIKIPTGIRCAIHNEWVLMCFPRSGLGFKYRLQLNNTVGIIDSDYYFSDNEGHIMLKITNDSHEGKEINIKIGDGFAQGIFIQYGVTLDDRVSEIRNGGFGSTGSSHS